MVIQWKILDLKSKGSFKPSSKIASLYPVLDGHGVLKVNRRVLSLPGTINSTNQIILQRITSFATRTMIRHTHELTGHLGREHIFSKVREKFCILRYKGKYHIIHSPQGFSGIIYKTVWGSLPECLKCSLQVMKEWVMMPSYMSVKVR